MGYKHGVDFDVWLGPYRIRVRFVDNIVADGEKCDGLFKAAEKEILIDSGLGPTEAYETFLHECVEAIDTLHDMGLSHQTITTLGIGLAQLLPRAEVLD